ncbi:MAG: bifunctional glutamate N-acetyltransferase/amino-acid acetyltransferase ArgJ [Kiritimatiellaeota bacterium]|nr:bifunctional glutamate N-acetyltransferase/amino-acid acetyltransferase ArgJ [Kiritimatiellota bacterium]
MKWIKNGGVTSAKGFKACGVAAGIKADRDDMGLLVSESPASVAGVFTSNTMAAAPVTLDRKRVRRGKAQAVIVNAGCANACTGKEGYRDAVRMASLGAKALGLRDTLVLVSSTGVIGRRLPMQRIAAGIGIGSMALSPKGGDAFAKAMMTTDTVDKQAAVSVTIGGKRVTVGGCCKGAGMMEPKLATMLAYLTTDAAVPPKKLAMILKEAVNTSFNRITVDGDQSTNDTVLLLAGGASGATLKTANDVRIFTTAVKAVCECLARKIVEDGEGATKFVTVNVRKAATAADALTAAKAVANSPLFKTACFGGDPNWGRVICAIGYSGAKAHPAKTRIHFDDICVYDCGTVADAATNATLAKVMKQKAFAVTVTLGMGRHDDTVYTCDFSYDYVKINGDYTT